MTDHVDWVAVRAAYEAGVETVAGIRARHGVSEDRLRRRREREGWLAREPVARVLSSRRGATPKSLIRRLTAILAGEVARLEERMTSEGDGRERDALLAGELAKTLTQLDRLAKASKHKGKAARPAEAARTARATRTAKASRTDGADDDGTDWRALLKAKLDRLHGQDGS